jgi:hypothetical protein
MRYIHCGRPHYSTLLFAVWHHACYQRVRDLCRSTRSGRRCVFLLRAE